MSSRCPTPALLKWLAPFLVFMAVPALTGCADTTDFQASLASRTESTEFTLPRGEDSGAPFELWDEVFIACPYTDVTTAPAPFAKAAMAVDTSSNEGAQWLLFAKDGKVKRISMNRTSIDFCLDGAVNNAHRHDQLWSAKKSDGAWLMTAVDHQRAG